MGWLSLIKKAPMFIGIAGLLAMAALCYVLWNKIDTLNQEVGKYQAQEEMMRNANRVNAISLAEVNEANAECVAQWEKTKEASAAAIINLQEQYNALSAKKEANKNTLTEVFTDEDCKKLGNINLYDVCPSLTNSLREHTKAILRNKD